MYSFSIIVPSRFVQDFDNLIYVGDIVNIPLIVGNIYMVGFYAGVGNIQGDFLNVGASSNTPGTLFIATGTTPTAWNNGFLANYNSEREIYPFYESNGITRELVENTKFERDKFNGTLLVKGDDYDMFYTYLNESAQNYSHKFEFRVYKDTVQIYTANLLMNGQYNTIEKLCSFTIETIDEYSNIINNRDVKYDIINSTIPVVSCNVEAKKNELEISDIAQDGFSVFAVFDNQVYASEIYYAPKYLADFLIANQGFFLLSVTNEVYKIGRDWDYSGAYPAPILGQFVYTTVEPTIDVNTTIWGDFYAINGSPTFEQATYTGGINYDALTDEYRYQFIIKAYFGETQILYTRLRRLDKTIEWLVNQMDSSIQFDANSFNYLNNHIEFANLLIAGITDIILNQSNTAEQDYPSTKGLLSFGQIMDLFAGHPYHLYWYLENISGTYYFRLKHISELITLGASQIDFTDLQSKNWCIDKGTFSFKEFWGKLILTNTYGNIEFLDQTIETKLVNVTNNVEKSFDTFYFDVWDIQNNKSKYPNLSVEQFVIISTNLGIGSSLINYFVNDIGRHPFDNFTFDFETQSISLDYAIGDLELARCFSYEFDVKTNQIYVIEFDSLEVVGSLEIYLSEDTNLQPNGTSLDLETDVLVYELSASYDFATSVVAIKTKGNSAQSGSLTFTDFRIYVKDVYQGRKSISELTGQPAMNSDLSIANLLENHGKYEFPVSPVKMFNVDTAVDVLKMKQQETILVPIYDQNDIDFRKYVTTNLGTECEVESLTINFNEDFAQIKVKL